MTCVARCSDRSDQSACRLLTITRIPVALRVRLLAPTLPFTPKFSPISFARLGTGQEAVTNKSGSGSRARALVWRRLEQRPPSAVGAQLTPITLNGFCGCASPAGACVSFSRLRHLCGGAFAFAADILRQKYHASREYARRERCLIAIRLSPG
jgi:hypothetical protein